MRDLVKGGTVLVAGALAALPVEAPAQTGTPPPRGGTSLDSLFVYWEGEYETARAAYESAYEFVYGETGLEDRWDDVLAQLAGLGGSGEDRRRGNLEARAKDLSDQIHREENELYALKEQWCRAREGLAEAIDARLELMDNREDTAGPSAEYLALNRRLVDVESEIGESFGSCEIQALPPFPGVRILPSDGPNQILDKARFLQSKRRQHEGVLANLDRQIDRLTRQRNRSNLLRALEDHQANEARFGRNQPPVEDEVSGGAAQEGGLQDTAVAALPGVRLEERLANLIEFRDEVAERVRELEEKEREFVGRAGGLS